MPDVNPAPWHVDVVSREDDKRMAELQRLLSDEQGTTVHKTGVIRLAVRRMHRDRCGDGV